VKYTIPRNTGIHSLRNNKYLPIHEERRAKQIIIKGLGGGIYTLFPNLLARRFYLDSVVS
jgi:hypothetical protein